MSEQMFPSWWGPKGGDPIQCRDAHEIGEGWIRHDGRYDVQTGCWVPAFGSFTNLARLRRHILIAIAAAEGIGHGPGARRVDLIAAIRAKRAAG